jgi:heterodisulfide reductase subunit A
MAAWAIPGFRLPREALETDIRRILARGVVLRTGVRFGTDITLDDLRREGIRSVILATGTMKSLPLGIPGEETPGVVDCLRFLRDFNQGIQADIGNHVLVVGGGNAAMDAARAARKAGANRVTVVYRRGRREMPADIDEIRDAEREGVSFRFLTAPVRVMPSSTQGVSGLVCTKTERVDMGDGGRPRPIPIPGTEHEIHGDMVISAIGQCVDPDPLVQGLGRENALGFSLAPESEPMGTGVEGVFAAGDVLNGPTSVVEAMASGRRAGQAVVTALSRADGD